MRQTTFGGTHPLERVEMMGIDFAVSDLFGATEAVITRAIARDGGYACFCNVHLFVSCQQEPIVKDAVRQAWAVFPDGLPIAWLQRGLGLRGAERVAGPDLMPKVFDRGQEVGLKHFLFGSTESVLESLESSLLASYPRALIVGSYAPPFGPVDGAALQLIRCSAADIVWCALGAPKQELWMHENADDLGGCLVLGVGAAFDFLAGSKRRAPMWMQNLGLEWFHRLVAEPRRLIGRYATTNAYFVAVSLGEILTKRYGARLKSRK